MRSIGAERHHGQDELVGLVQGIKDLVLGHGSARLYVFDRSLEEAAHNLGAPAWRSLFEVTLPLIAPALIGAALVAFKVSFDEIVGSVFWSSTREQTLPVLLFRMLSWDLTPR